MPIEAATESALERSPPIPCRKTTAGQPPAGGVPAGRPRVAASCVPSAETIVTSVEVALEPVAAEDHEEIAVVARDPAEPPLGRAARHHRFRNATSTTTGW